MAQHCTAARAVERRSADDHRTDCLHSALPSPLISADMWPSSANSQRGLRRTLFHHLCRRYTRCFIKVWRGGSGTGGREGIQTAALRFNWWLFSSSSSVDVVLRLQNKVDSEKLAVLFLFPTKLKLVSCCQNFKTEEASFIGGARAAECSFIIPPLFPALITRQSRHGFGLNQLPSPAYVNLRVNSKSGESSAVAS